jgi:hypothetical protein
MNILKESNTMNNDEIFFTMALTRISNFNYATALQLYRAVGSAQLIFEHRHYIGDILQDCSPRLMEALKDWDEPMKRAEAELQYMQAHGIRALTLTDEDYPQRLSECPDAPIILYYRGNADLNQRRIISIVGTRHCTTYGQDIIRRFIEDLHYYCPKVLVVSGLAYGVDINAHRLTSHFSLFFRQNPEFLGFRLFPEFEPLMNLFQGAVSNLVEPAKSISLGIMIKLIEELLFAGQFPNGIRKTTIEGFRNIFAQVIGCILDHLLVNDAKMSL